MKEDRSGIEMVEGGKAFRRFDSTMKQLLSVSHSEMERREKQYRKEGPHKRGPKPKINGAS